MSPSYTFQLSVRHFPHESIPLANSINETIPDDSRKEKVSSVRIWLKFHLGKVQLDILKDDLGKLPVYW